MIHKRDWPLAAGFGALVVVGVAALIAPSMRSRLTLQREIASLRAELAKPSTGPDAIEQLRADLASLRSFSEGRNTPIPMESDVAGLVRSLSTTLTDLGLDQRDITTRDARKIEGAWSMPLTVSVTGPFLKIYETIRAVEGLPRLVRVERLRLALPESRAQNRSGTSDVKAEILVEAFFAPPVTTVTEAGTGGGP